MDIVERLRDHECWNCEKYNAITDEAADEIERLREALNLLLDGVITYAPDYMHAIPKREYIDIAKDALKGKP